MSRHIDQINLLWNENVYFPDNIVGKAILNKVRVSRFDTPRISEGPAVRASTNQVTQGLKTFVQDQTLVIADTITWPMELQASVSFVGQFSWDLYWTRVQGLEEKNRNLHLPASAWSMKNFVWEGTIESFKPNIIEILDYWSLRDYTVFQGSEIWVMRSHAYRLNKIEIDRIRYLAGVVKVIEIGSIELALKSTKRKPLGVIARAGMGAISECISAKIPILYLPSEDFEIAFNESILERLGVGLNFFEIVLGDLVKLPEKLIRYSERVEWPTVIPSSQFGQEILEAHNLLMN